jgi:hypothetical protein
LTATGGPAFDGQVTAKSLQAAIDPETRAGSESKPLKRPAPSLSKYCCKWNRDSARYRATSSVLLASLPLSASAMQSVARSNSAPSSRNTI